MSVSLGRNEVSQPSARDAVEDAIDAFVERARFELDHRRQAWRVDLEKKEVHEVIGALLARQVTLATRLAQAPNLWDGHTAPLFLRAMADVYIILAWIIADPVDRARKFIHYGLGQQKLQLEHRRAEFAGREPRREEKLAIEAMEEWMNSQRLIYLTEVNLGSWSGLTTRDMADQAGCLDFYNFVYTPFSACTHSMWHHIARYNLEPCQNPLHQFHHIPRDPELHTDVYYFYLGGKYLEKILTTSDRWAGIAPPSPTAFQVLESGLDRVSQLLPSSDAGETPEPPGESV